MQPSPFRPPLAPVHTMPEELKNPQSQVILDLCLKKSRAGKSRDYHDVIVFEKLRFQNVFRPHENTKLSFLNSSGLKSVLEELRFRDGLVWTVRLTVETKLRFLNGLVWMVGLTVEVN